MIDINKLINAFESGHSFQIRIWCEYEVAEIIGLDISRRVHNSPACNYIKAQPGCMARCMRCRSAADRRTFIHGASFGYCVFGLCNLMYPISFCDGKRATVYITDLMPQDGYDMLRSACLKNRIDYSELVRKVSVAESLSDDNADVLLCTARVVSEYTALIYQERYAEYTSQTLPDAVLKLKEYAEELYGELSLAELARKLHFNEKYLGRVFTKFLGKSFSEYRNDYRLNVAADMLKSVHGRKKMKISDVAYAVGFSDTAYFSRMFRKKFNMTPKKYAQNHE